MGKSQVLIPVSETPYVRKTPYLLCYDIIIIIIITIIVKILIIISIVKQLMGRHKVLKQIYGSEHQSDTFQLQGRLPKLFLIHFMC